MPRGAGEIPLEVLQIAQALDRAPRSWRQAVRSCGGVTAFARIVHSKDAELDGLLATFDECDFVRAAVLRQRVQRCDPLRQRDQMDALGAGLVLIEDDDYPAMLAASSDPPLALWIRGQLQREDAWSVAVVGSRRATAYGIEQAGRFAAAFAAAEIAVVSGAARGIDGEAHRGALRAEGRTVAVVGGGLAEPYPPEHRELLDEIVASGGAVISECPVDAPATPDRFPSRNRVLAGLSAATLVVEAATRSGAMITAGLAIEAGRACMAVPGPVHSGRSAGCHRLIQSMQAVLVESPDDAMHCLIEHASSIAGAEQLRAAGFDPPRRAIDRQLSPRL
ncbi:MAG: DNA-protecting protein DprA [Planctomycetes bacterium]|nr:DNA-protecting protein DprA [Planctomycetota bacterium]